MIRTIPLERARRIALGAQGFTTPRPDGRIDVRHFRRVLGLNRVVQLDSVNVSARAHYLPFFSRLGPYDRDALDRWLWRSGENFEHWGHEASVMPVALHRLMRHRMEDHPWGGPSRLADEKPELIEAVHAHIAEAGPLSISDLDQPRERGESWWGWDHGKQALSYLWTVGRIAVHHRDRMFKLHYDLPERVIPRPALDAPTPTREEAQRELLLLGARAQGVATAKDLADHFRLPIREARPLVDALASEGLLEEVQVAGWRDRAFLHPDATTPRRVDARALLSPFDPVVWHRERGERLFDFRYRIEIYVPQEKREHGYYVLPFLLGDRLAARVDLKSDRKAGVLRVKGVFLEDGLDPTHVARELATELRTFARWQDLTDVTVAPHGDLAPTLARALD